MTKMALQAASTFIAQTSAAPAGAPAAGGPGGGYQILIFYALIAVGFYFLFIAPQRKKQKEQEKMLAALGTGDDVLTTSGIFGTITNVKDDRFVLRVGDNTKIEIAKGFVQSVIKKPGSEEKK